MCSIYVGVHVSSSSKQSMANYWQLYFKCVSVARGHVLLQVQKCWIISVSFHQPRTLSLSTLINPFTWSSVTVTFNMQSRFMNRDLHVQWLCMDTHCFIQFLFNNNSLPAQPELARCHPSISPLMWQPSSIFIFMLLININAAKAPARAHYLMKCQR